MEIAIIGAGGMAKEIWGLCQRMEYEVLGFVTKRLDGADQYFHLPILGSDVDFLRKKKTNCVIAVGSPRVKREIVEMYLSSPHVFPNVVHPAAITFGRLTLGDRGITIMPGGVIQPDVTIGNFVHINMGVTIGHDVTIGPYSIVNHNAGISGDVTIGKGVLIGAGATIIEGNTIGDGAIVGAGAVVTKNVPAGETWVGVPARHLTGQREKPASYAELYGVQ